MNRSVIFRVIAAHIIFVFSVFPGLASWGQQDLITVGPNVHVSRANGDRQHFETQVAANPTNPRNLLGCSIISPAEKDRSPVEHKTIVYASFDGGESWEPTLEVGPDLVSRDPACVFGADGTAYFVAFGFTPDFKEQHMFVYRSKDGGKTWPSPTILPIVDRPFITVDATGSKYRGRVYVHGTSGTRMFESVDGMSQRSITELAVFRSTDGGAKFEEVKLAGAGKHHVLGTGNSVVLSDGTFVWVFGVVKEYWRDDGSFGIPENKPNQSNTWLKVITSSDGGEDFTKAVVISDWYLRFYGSVNCIPIVAVDQSDGPFKDRLYVVWADARSGRTEVLLAYSSDKGKTWSKPVVVNDDWPRTQRGEGPDDHMPVVAVNPAGVVGVMWYDRRDNPDNLGWWVRFAASLDGGETFLPSVRVSEAPSALEQQNRPLVLATETRGGGNPAVMLRANTFSTEVGLTAFQFMGGDTAGMAADSTGLFHPFWIDNRTGIAQVWTVPVSVRGKARRNGSADLENLSDITQKVYLDFGAAYYDPSSKTISAEVHLTNTSNETLSGPIKVKVLSVASKVGMPEIINSDNQLLRSGAIWDFSTLLDGNILRPGARTKPKRIQLRLTDPGPLRPVSGTRFAVNFANIETKVLGKVQQPSAK